MTGTAATDRGRSFREGGAGDGGRESGPYLEQDAGFIHPRAAQYLLCGFEPPMLRGHTEHDLEMLRKYEAMDPGEFSLAPMLAELTYAKGDDRLMVLTAHGLVERILTGILKHKAKRGGKVAALAHATKLLLANEMGLLADREYEELDWFRRLRNDAAHEAYFVLTDKHRQHLASNRYFDTEMLCVTYPGGETKSEDLLFHYSMFSIFAAFCPPADSPAVSPST